MELGVYTCGAALLTYEYSQSLGKERAKQEALEARFQALHGEIEQVNRQNADMLIVLKSLKSARDQRRLPVGP